MFSHNSRIDNNTLSSIDGATALKLDDSLQLNEEEQSDSFSNLENEFDDVAADKAEWKNIVLNF